MCDICRSHKCLYGCPNADDPPEVFICEICGDSIVVGDDYIKFDEYYHRDCFEELDTGEIVELLGGEIGEASEYDINDGSDEEYERNRDEALFDC